MALVKQFQVTFDCAEPERVARFWCEVLGYVVPPPPEGFATWDDFDRALPPERQGSAFACIDPSGVGPRLFFQRVPEGKVVKNRVHLDVRVGTGLVGEERLAALEAECARLVALGAVRVRLLPADGYERVVPRDAGRRGQRVLSRLSVTCKGVRHAGRDDVAGHGARPGRATLESWAHAIDEGPFSSLCFGERMAFDNPETFTLLGAVAAWTERVPLVTTVVVPQLRHPVMLAKALATADLLCTGRLHRRLWVSVVAMRTTARSAPTSAPDDARDGREGSKVMRRVWARELVTDAVRAVGPSPGPAGRARRSWWARWACAQCSTPPAGPTAWPGSRLDLDVDAVGDTVLHWRARSWAEAGPAPHPGSPPRSSSPWATRRPHVTRCTGTCATT